MIRIFQSRSRRTAAKARKYCRHAAAFYACAAAAVAVWPASALADTAPEPTVDSRLIVVVVIVVAIVALAAIAWFAIRRLRRQRTEPGSGPQNGGGGEER